MHMWMEELIQSVLFVELEMLAGKECGVRVFGILGTTTPIYCSILEQFDETSPLYFGVSPCDHPSGFELLPSSVLLSWPQWFGQVVSGGVDCCTLLRLLHVPHMFQTYQCHSFGESHLIGPVHG